MSVPQAPTATRFRVYSTTPGLELLSREAATSAMFHKLQDDTRVAHSVDPERAAQMPALVPFPIELNGTPYMGWIEEVTKRGPLDTSAEVIVSMDGAPFGAGTIHMTPLWARNEDSQE